MLALILLARPIIIFCTLGPLLLHFRSKCAVNNLIKPENIATQCWQMEAGREAGAGGTPEPEEPPPGSLNSPRCINSLANGRNEPSK